MKVDPLSSERLKSNYDLLEKDFEIGVTI